MCVQGQCANCGAPLPPGQPADHNYCEKCASAWQRGKASQELRALGVDDVTRSVQRECANCGASLPPDQPADHNYCEKCASAWQRGNASRHRSAH
jgi:predicted RNA-binding Zn-ribbon protein involved in translation (DUF1610 family)